MTRTIYMGVDEGATPPQLDALSVLHVLIKRQHDLAGPYDLYLVSIPPGDGRTQALATALNVVPWRLKGLYFESPHGPCLLTIAHYSSAISVSGKKLSHADRHSAIRLAKASTKRRRKRKLPPRRKYVPQESIRVTVGDLTCTGDSLGPLLPEAD